MSVGRKGATSNISAKGVKHTVGLPGSGLGYQTRTQKGWIAILLAVAAAIVLVFILKVYE